ncbi:MAG: M48 family metallopeptidase [Bacteroidia bacterium]
MTNNKNKVKKRVLFLSLLIIQSFGVYGQKLTHHPIWCSGDIPPDFLKYQADIIEEIDSLGSDKAFELPARLNIKELLQSGMVLFGDSVSTVVNIIGERILNKNGISEDVKFLVLRSSIFNAFSTDQGFIFITTETIAEVQNSEQLAFIMCHELSHFIKKHNYLSYERKIKIDSKRYPSESQKEVLEYFKYSRENEFQADDLGIELFLNAGFDKANAISAITNLAPHNRWVKGYYWTFDYLEDQYFHFPDVYTDLDNIHLAKYEKLFPSYYTFKTITDESIKDSAELSLLNTHPDWKDRLSKVVTKLLRDSASLEFPIEGKINPEYFALIQKMCRWESVFRLMAQSDYLLAHYKCLEMSYLYGNTEELFFYQTISLNAIFYQYFKNRDILRHATPIIDIEGLEGFNISHMFRFFNLLTEDEWVTILSRENLMLKLLFKENEFVDHYLNLSIKNLKEDIIDDFDHYTAEQIMISDSVKVYRFKHFSDKSKPDSSLYCTVDSINGVRKKYITSAFRVFSLSSDSSTFQHFFDSIKTVESEKFIYYSRTFHVGSKTEEPTKKHHRRTQMDTIILFSLDVNCFNYGTLGITPTPEKNEITIDKISVWQNQAASNLNMVLQNQTSLNTTSKKWNDRYIINSWIGESLATSNFYIKPLFYKYLEQIDSNEKTNLLLNSSFYFYDNGVRRKGATLWLKPIMDPLVALIFGVRKKPKSYFVFILFDTKEKKIILVHYEGFTSNLYKDFGQAHIYEMMYEIKKLTQLNEK